MQVKNIKYARKMKKYKKIGQGGANRKMRGMGSKTNRPKRAKPKPAFIPDLCLLRASGSVQSATLYSLHKNKILQHKTCSIFYHDSNDIRFET